MFCTKCGKLIPDGSVFCSKCGERIISETEAERNKTVFLNDGDIVVVGAITDEKIEPPTLHSKKKKNIIIATVIVVIAAVIAVTVAVQVIQTTGKNSLKEQLLRDWNRVEGGNGSYYILELDFSENEIKYNFESTHYWFNKNIKTMKYKVISPNKIKLLDYKRVIEIDFNDDKTMMICTPAITSTDISETWFNIDG